MVNEAFGDLCVEKYGWPRELIHYIPQRIELEAYEKSKVPYQNGIGQIAMIRGLDHFKAQGVLNVLRTMEDRLSRAPNATITIAGDGNCRSDVERAVREINDRLGRQVVRCVGYVEDISALIARHAIILGSERCVIEALACGKTAFVLSNFGDVWQVTPERLDLLAKDNFIGEELARRRVPKASGGEIVRTALGSNPSAGSDKCREWIVGQYDAAVGSQRLYDLLSSLVSERRHLRSIAEYFGAFLFMYLIVGRDFVARRLGLRTD